MVLPVEPVRHAGRPQRLRDGDHHRGREDPEGPFYCSTKDGKIRTAQRMDRPETLIARYDLKDWVNPGYPGRDPSLRSKPALETGYCGLLRRAPN